MPHQDVGIGKRFPTDWHRDRYADDLERELAGLRVRLGAEDERPDDKNTEKHIVEELKGLGRTSAKRPAGAQKETRA